MSMWKRTENGESRKPPEVFTDNSGVIVRRDYKQVPATEDMPEHWEYEEWQMSHAQYEVYQAMRAESNDIEDALIELAEIITGGE